jgi:hypothetical protein
VYCTETTVLCSVKNLLLSIKLQSLCKKLYIRLFNTYFTVIAHKTVNYSLFNRCLSVHVDNYTIIVPTKCTSLLKAQDITICTFLSLYS